MNVRSLSFAHAISIADLWKQVGGQPDIEIGALEPLLWRDGNYRIHDLVAAFTDMGFVVSMTTNGQLLEMYAKELARAGLSRIRTSWHSTDPLMFREVSGGYGDHERFMRGVRSAIDSGIQIAFNRVLLKGYTNDISEQLDFIDKHRCKLKLYTLLWTPEIAGVYSDMYIDWRAIIRENVSWRAISITRKGKKVGRKRIIFHLARGGTVEVKVGDILNRSISPCESCSMKHNCEEGFGDYVRVDPRLMLYFCYLRRDLGFALAEYFGRPVDFKNRLQDAVGKDVNLENLLVSAPLRFTVTPHCNFNCRVPGTKHSWCMEEPGEYTYPRIRDTLLQNAKS